MCIDVLRMRQARLARVADIERAHMSAISSSISVAHTVIVCGR